MSLPTFFMSYARQDDEQGGRYLSKFFKDLETTVAALAGHALQNGDLGTIDLRVPAGSDWNAALGDALANGRAFVLLETPLYYNRPHCGRELFCFLQRSPDLGIDQHGRLTGVQNVFRIRWLREEAYGVIGQTPAILNLIEFTPAQTLDDDETDAAIQRYIRKGMKRCVDQEPHYQELLEAFALAILKAVNPPPLAGDNIGAHGIFMDSHPDAFQHDWHSHFASPRSEPVKASSAAPGLELEPLGLKSVVAFHITAKRLPVMPGSPDFADCLIDEQVLQETPGAAACLFEELVEATGTENLRLINVTPTESIPLPADRLAEQLRALARRGVPSLLVIDPEWLRQLPAGTGANELRNLVADLPDWTGTVLIADRDGGPPTLLPTEGRFAVPGATVLPSDRQARAFELSRILVEARGRAMRALSAQAGGGSPLPLIGGARAA